MSAIEDISSSSSDESVDELTDKDTADRRNGFHKSNSGTEELDAEKILKKEERELIITNGSSFRLYMFEIVSSKTFSFGILFVIIVNTIFIGIYTSHTVVAKAEWYLAFVDNIFLAIYIMELVMKCYVWRLKYFTQLWNLFDFVIVVASFVDFIIPLIVQNMANFNAKVFKVLRVFRAIRALRALRVLRTIRFLKNLQIIVSAVLQSIPAMGSIILLISLVLYIFAIVGRGLYSDVDPERFGNLAKASFTLFQLITLDDWFFVYSDVIEKYPNYQHILLYLISFIILETFIFINLFVAVIVDNLARTQAAINTSKKTPSTSQHKSDYDSELHLPKVNSHCKTGKHLMSLITEKSPQNIEDYYPPEKYTEKERHCLEQYWQLLACLEHHLQTEQNCQDTLNELVDLVDFAKN